jgi:hypothetical protein
MALLITVLIALIALGLLGIRRGSYASSRAVVNSVQARALARSGLNDIWVKLSKDPFFPTGIGDDQEQFSYREEVTNSRNEIVGSYTVKVDRTFRRTLNVVRIESTGRVGGLTENSSTHTIYAELSTDAGDFAFKVWQEGTKAKL